MFQVPPPNQVLDDIAVDDDLTHHLIRRQFTRNATNDPEPRRPSRRDSMFPGIPAKKLRGSLDESDENTAARLEQMEKSMRRMEAMLARFVPSIDDNEEAVEDDGDEVMDESGTLRGGGTTESSFRDPMGQVL